MNSEQAENSITLSALVVGGIFAYRKVVEPSTPGAKELRESGQGGVRAQNLYTDYKSVFGAAPPIPWSQWIKAAGFMYIAIAILGSASPDIGGSLAILVGTSAVIGNGVAVMNDLKRTEPAENIQAKRRGERLENDPLLQPRSPAPVH